MLLIILILNDIVQIINKSYRLLSKIEKQFIKKKTVHQVLYEAHNTYFEYMWHKTMIKLIHKLSEIVLTISIKLLTNQLSKFFQQSVLLIIIIVILNDIVQIINKSYTLQYWKTIVKTKNIFHGKHWTSFNINSWFVLLKQSNFT